MLSYGYLWFPTLHFVDEMWSVMQKKESSAICWLARAKALQLNIGKRKSLIKRGLHKRY